MNSVPDSRELLLVGGGHAHVAVLRAFAMRPLPGLRLTVVSRELHTPYSGMLPGLIAGHYAFDDAHIDLGPLAAAAGARLIQDEATSMDPANRRVTLASGRVLRYDWVSINCGIRPDLQGVEDPDGCVVPVKPIGQLLPRLATLLDGDDAGRRSVVIAGGGAGGLELALALAWRWRGHGGSIALATAGEQIAPQFNRRARASLEQALQRAGVAVHTGFRVASVAAGLVHSANGLEIDGDLVLWCTQAAPPAWLQGSGLSLSGDGFLEVEPTLQARSHDNVFGAGDAVELSFAPRPRSGVFAVRAGPVLADNLRAVALGTRLRRFRPQRQFLSLVSTGPRHAVAARGPWSAAGAWLWNWKDWIDRRFVERYRDLPTMDPEAPLPRQRLALPPAEQQQAEMRCGGCGAKLGASLLERVLHDLDQHACTTQPIARDDAAVVPWSSSDVIMTVDGFRAFIDDPWWFGRLAAVHALGDIHAMGARPSVALAHATVPFAAEALMEDDLRQLMNGVLTTLNEAQAELAGGHSAEGAELSLSLTVAGEPDGAPLTKGALAAGQALIVTQPIGSGVLFAGAMRGLTRSRDQAAAMGHMVQLSNRAASILRAHGASAATDITGFGLLGHAAEMARAAGLQIALWPDAVPLYTGAAELVEQGVVSSLQVSNRQTLADFDRSCLPAAPTTALELICDPQTCGGLLSAVPESEAQRCVDALRQAGYRQACVVGRVLDQAAVPGRSGQLLLRETDRG